MFERLTTREETLIFKLGAALTMERTVLVMLAEFEQHAQRDDLRELFRRHTDETRSHIANIEKSFQLLGEDVIGTDSPAIEGLQQETSAAIGRADGSVVDALIAVGVVETEHHEIGVYESLVTKAEARGADKVVRLLAQNLRQEEAALEKAKAISKAIERDGMAFSV
ncbi:MAG: ferritin-like domain-containing protein [Gaiellaceae bacterium]